MRILVRLIAASVLLVSIVASHRYLVGRAYANGFMDGVADTSSYVAANFMCFEILKNDKSLSGNPPSSP